MLDNKLVIDIPKGMEVDVEKSDLKAGIIAFKKKEISYADVLSALAGKGVCPADIKVPEMIAGKIIALARLMTIAKYYNGDWKPDWNSQEISIISCEPANMVLLLVVIITKVLFTSRTKKMPKPLLIIRISEAFLMQSIRTKAYEGNVF